jgi:hypothetical protein
MHSEDLLRDAVTDINKHSTTVLDLLTTGQESDVAHAAKQLPLVKNALADADKAVDMLTEDLALALNQMFE